MNEKNNATLYVACKFWSSLTACSWRFEVRGLKFEVLNIESQTSNLEPYY
jgi:hypothetical protein